MSVVALLDDRHASEQHPTSRLYTGFVREHRCADPAALDATWAAVEADQRTGLHALLLADYEWGARLLKAGHERLAPADQGALRVLMFERCERLSHAQAGRWLADQPEADGPAGTMQLQASVDRAEFTSAIARIHEAIAAGETYQVNYTYRLHGQVWGSPLALFRQLRERQPVAYGAYIVLPVSGQDGETTHVLSCSPELFVRVPFVKPNVCTDVFSVAVVLFEALTGKHPFRRGDREQAGVGHERASHHRGHGGTDIARPAVLLLDGKGVIRWAMFTDNFRVRARPEALLRAAQQLR